MNRDAEQNFLVGIIDSLPHRTAFGWEPHSARSTCTTSLSLREVLNLVYTSTSTAVMLLLMGAKYIYSTSTAVMLLLMGAKYTSIYSPQLHALAWHRRVGSSTTLL
jgi:hypothetical protein